LNRLIRTKYYTGDELKKAKADCRTVRESFPGGKLKPRVNFDARAFHQRAHSYLFSPSPTKVSFLFFLKHLANRSSSSLSTAPAHNKHPSPCDNH
jgi:hypothetical protein